MLVLTEKHSAISFTLCVLFQASMSNLRASFLSSVCSIILACYNCEYTIDTDEDDYDSILE